MLARKGSPVSKSDVVRLRIAPTKKAVWQHAAGRNRLSLSAYLTAAGDAAANGPPFLSPAEIDALHGLNDQLRRAGVNLNTLLRELNAYQIGRAKHGPNAADFAQLRDELGEALGQVRTFLGTKT